MPFSTWTELCDHLGKQFEIDLDLNGVLFLVGIRERGLTFQPFSKEEKLSLINLGSCTLYLEMGLLDKIGTDSEGWPVFTQKALAPVIPEERKHKVLQDCALRYFKKIYPTEAG
jgi:hypothetical protein